MGGEPVVEEVLDAEPTAEETSETVNKFLEAEYPPWALPVFVAVVIGAAGYAFMEWRKKRAEDAMAKTLERGMFGADEDDTPALETDDKGMLSGEGGDTDAGQSEEFDPSSVDLSGYNPDVEEAWEEFQKTTQGTDYAENIPSLVKCLKLFEEHLPSSHHCTVQGFIHLARSYQHAQKWLACDKLCARATDKIDTVQAGGSVKQAMITLLCCQGLACFREPSGKRYAHAENCYRRGLKVVREMSHPSWRPVELQTAHDFARELIGAGKTDLAQAEVAKSLQLLQLLENPPKPSRPDGASSDSEEEEQPPPPPQIRPKDAALSRCNLMRTLAHAQTTGGDKIGAETTLRKALKLADSVGNTPGAGCNNPDCKDPNCKGPKDQGGQMAMEFCRRELAQLYLNQPDRAREAEPLLRETLGLLQARSAPMTLWLEIATELNGVLMDKGEYQEAHRWATQVLQHTCNTCGADSPQTVLPLQKLGLATWALGDIKRAGDSIMQVSPR